MTWCACVPAVVCSQLWRLSQDSPVAVFKHEHEVFTIKWSPAPPAEGQGQLLATTSLDKTVRLFDTQSGRCGWLVIFAGSLFMAAPFSFCFVDLIMRHNRSGVMHSCCCCLKHLGAFVLVLSQGARWLTHVLTDSPVLCCVPLQGGCQV